MKTNKIVGSSVNTQPEACRWLEAMRSQIGSELQQYLESKYLIQPEEIRKSMALPKERLIQLDNYIKFRTVRKHFWER
jgi:hypothetical protein